jgi:hypothetical protein
MGKIDRVMVTRERVLERKRVVLPLLRIPQVVLIIRDVRTRAMPASLRVILAIRQNLHPLIVQAVRLCQINDVESDFVPTPRIRDLEEVPLRVAIRVDIIL